MYNLIHKLNHRSFIKRYSRRDDIVRLIPERDKALTDAFRMFSVGMINFAILSAKWPSLRYLSSSILWSRFRFQDHSDSQILEHEATNGTQAVAPAVNVDPVASAEDTKRPSFIARRMTLKSFQGKHPVMIKYSKTESTAEGQEMSISSASATRTRDTLDREFIESGLDALRIMSKGMESTLPSYVD